MVGEKIPKIFAVTADVGENIVDLCNIAGFADIFEQLNEEVIKEIFSQVGLNLIQKQDYALDDLSDDS